MHSVVEATLRLDLNSELVITHAVKTNILSVLISLLEAFSSHRNRNIIFLSRWCSSLFFPLTG